MYFCHPSKQLQQAFALKPYQGIAPELAQYLFVGLDANYDKNIEFQSVFVQILEYLKDGVTFWRKNNVHHPFLLSHYKGDGQFFHKSFARIGFGTEHAEKVSFVELLHVPTYGRSSLVLDDLDHAHLDRINHAIMFGAARHIFIPSGVARLMRLTGLFSWMPRNPLGTRDGLDVWYKSESKVVYSHYHFSVFGKFEQRKQAQLRAMRLLVPDIDDTFS